MGKMSAHVQRLTESSRPNMREHFLRLEDEDVRLRFGAHLPPASIASYVDHIDFDNDAVLGVYDGDLHLIGVAHVAVADGSAELGISVTQGQRGHGIGSALFARAAELARNRFVRRLYMHCLSENAAMMHIARKSGMTICVDTGEADAYLCLAPADAVSLAGELVDQRLAVFDYALKTEADTMRRIVRSFDKP